MYLPMLQRQFTTADVADVGSQWGTHSMVAGSLALQNSQQPPTRYMRTHMHMCTLVRPCTLPLPARTSHGSHHAQ